MREIKKAKEMFLWSQRHKNHGKTVGFVPTMGALHEGHLSLISEAKIKCDMVVVSIFVNPTQFSPAEDYNNYPRNYKNDKNTLKKMEVDVLFMPEVPEMYPPGTKTFVEVEGLSKRLCGISRPTHFRGVATVVAKLFDIVAPDIAFFGEKDYQQQLIIKQMVRDLNLPLEVVSLPTIREFDGVAKSSRNINLNERERKAAGVLFKALKMAKEEIEKGEKDPKRLIMRLRSLIAGEPLFRIDYVVLADPETLEDAKHISGKVLIALAGYVGKTRLIDNMVVG
ncbi:MAG: pantoate--beta-alanine ligase [Candidatus Margulisiibacteriota bacterium]